MTHLDYLLWMAIALSAFNVGCVLTEIRDAFRRSR